MKQLIIVLFVLVFVGGGFYYFGNKKGATTPYTLAEIAKHSTKEDCWMAVEGKVYDVTPFVASGMHKGKDAILMGCGKDATQLYNNRPNGSGAHSQMARSLMAKFAIGVLN